jgi:hypothetical protein
VFYPTATEGLNSSNISYEMAPNARTMPLIPETHFISGSNETLVLSHFRLAVDGLVTFRKETVNVRITQYEALSRICCRGKAISITYLYMYVCASVGACVFVPVSGRVRVNARARGRVHARDFM